MSVPRTMRLPAGVRPARVGAGLAHGPLAALRAEAGERRGAPALLVPGFTGSKEDFLPLLPLLAAAGHDAVAVDLRGQYESAGPDEPAAYTVPALAGEVTVVVQELSITTGGGPVHLVGHSFGGLVARCVALAGDAPLASLALLGSGPGAIPPPTADVLGMLEPVLADGGVPAVWEASQALEPPAADLPADVAAFLQRRFLAANPVGLRVMADGLRSEPDRTDALATLGLPLLVAHGAADDAWPPAVQAEMARRLGAPHAVIDGSVHSPAVENPAQTARVLTRFWAGLAVR